MKSDFHCTPFIINGRLAINMNNGAFYTQKYRNIFKECGYSDNEIENKVYDTWNKLFFGDENTRIYYPVGENMAYILDTGNVDVRTEGMSYGMMMCVQLDRREEFDRLWAWTKRYMLHTEGEYQGYFAWSCAPDGIRNAEGPAPDGEEYFAMALLFASHRWGDGQEPYDYSTQAKAILHECVHKGENGIGSPMWEPKSKLIKFTPEADFTDPSYHLPHFYELFSLWGNQEDKEFWKAAASASREYLKQSCHPLTGLASEYAYYNGMPYKASWDYGHHHFYSDSYRVAANIGLDYEWFCGDPWEKVEADSIQEFFEGIDDISNYMRYTIDGIPTEEKSLHPIGLLATNAMASLATSGPISKKCVERFWNTPLRTGKRRYYDNCLYFFSVLALSGRYRIW